MPSTARSAWRTSRSIPPRTRARQRARRTWECLEPWRAALAELGLTLEDVEAQEPEPAVGNGGLGRLAACFLDSLATLGYPGVRLRHQLRVRPVQAGDRGRLAARAARSLAGRSATPWLIERPDEACIVPLYGRIEHEHDAQGRYSPRWVDMQILIGVPLGHADRRLRRADGELRCGCTRRAPSDEFDMAIFNAGDYIRAVERKVLSETVSKVLYPSDTVRRGRELRLVQEYFLVACALRDIVRRHQRDARHLRQLRREGRDPDERHAPGAGGRRADAHPGRRARAGVGARRGRSTRGTLRLHEPHAAARGARAVAGVDCSSAVLPRHLQIIYEINRRLLERGPRAVPGRRRARAAACRSSTRRRRRTCAWPTWRSPAATRSTASPRCTASS